MLEPQLQPVLTEDIPELSKAAVMAITRYMRAKGFFEVYLDDTLKAELTSDERLVHEVHTVGPMQQALREVYAEWGVSTSAKKALERVPEALVQGGRIDGVAGRGEPSPDKLDKTMCMCWDLIGMRRPDWRQLAATGGQLCFLCQWRRAGFCLLPAWPDAILLDDVRAVTQRTTDQLAARAPTVDVVVHLAGSPCPGLCA